MAYQQFVLAYQQLVNDISLRARGIATCNSPRADSSRLNYLLLTRVRPQHGIAWMIFDYAIIFKSPYIRMCICQRHQPVIATIKLVAAVNKCHTDTKIQ